MEVYLYRILNLPKKKFDEFLHSIKLQKLGIIIANSDSYPYFYSTIGRHQILAQKEKWGFYFKLQRMRKVDLTHAEIWFRSMHLIDVGAESNILPRIIMKAMEIPRKSYVLITLNDQSEYVGALVQASSNSLTIQLIDEDGISLTIPYRRIIELATAPKQFATKVEETKQRLKKLKHKAESEE